MSQNLPVTNHFVNQEDIDRLDTDKLSEDLLKALYAVNSALFQNAGNEVNRLGRFKYALDHLEERLTDPEYLDSLDEDERLHLYKVLQSHSKDSSEYLLKLSTSMSNGLDSISKIKAVKTSIDSKPTINLPSSEVERKDLLSKVREELRKRG